ncbi:hypothetical protein D3C83_164280 [compost metagenome]
MLRARNETLRTKPDNVKSFFESRFRKIVPTEPLVAPGAVPIKALKGEDPYGF